MMESNDYREAGMFPARLSQHWRLIEKPFMQGHRQGDRVVGGSGFVFKARSWGVTLFLARFVRKAPDSLKAQNRVCQSQEHAHKVLRNWKKKGSRKVFTANT